MNKIINHQNANILESQSSSSDTVIKRTVLWTAAVLCQNEQPSEEQKITLGSRGTNRKKKQQKTMTQ